MTAAQQHPLSVAEVPMRKIILAILLSLTYLGLLLWKLPMLCISRCRCVRFLPLAGIAYYGLIVTLAITVFELVWWEIVFLGLAVSCGDCLLPDPFTFFFRPRKRRAVIQAIEYLEVNEHVVYGTARVIGSEEGRTIVSVAIRSSLNPPHRLFFAVADDGRPVKELAFEYVAEKHGVKGQF